MGSQSSSGVCRLALVSHSVGSPRRILRLTIKSVSSVSSKSNRLSAASWPASVTIKRGAEEISPARRSTRFSHFWVPSMLQWVFPNQKLIVQHNPVRAGVGKNGGVTVKLFVGAQNALSGRARIVHRSHINAGGAVLGGVCLLG